MNQTTPVEYLRKNKPFLGGLRFALFHCTSLLRAALAKIEQPFREAPNWVIAVAATYRTRYGERNEARSLLETMAYHAEREFRRRAAIGQV